MKHNPHSDGGHGQQHSTEGVKKMWECVNNAMKVVAAVLRMAGH